MKKVLLISVVLLLAPFTWADATFQAADVAQQTNAAFFEFEKQRAGDLAKKKYAKDFKLRGWGVAHGVYFGGTKVADEWGIGFVYERGDTTYGFNNRGVQVVTRF